MLKFITLICALAGLFIAISLEAWLRSHMEKNESTMEIYSEVRSRNSQFRSVQIVPLILIIAAGSAAIYFGTGLLDAAAFSGGAVICFISYFIGSRASVSGSVTASSLALCGNVRDALRSAYRSASFMGLCISSISLLGLGMLYYFVKTSQVISIAACLGLGAAAVSLYTGLSGTVFSAAYALFVKNDDFTDYSGMFAGSGADHAGSYILSVCASALLAEVAIDTSGVMSTFTRTSAARYPLIVLAAGIAASVIGILSYRARIVKNPAVGLTAGNIIAAAVVTAASVYFSNDLMQSYIYSYCAASGIIAALVSGEIMKLFSSEGYMFRRYIPAPKSVGVSRSMLFSLSEGLVSVMIPLLISAAAMVISYKFASFYGVALAAAGVNSMLVVNFSVRGFSINTASASEISSAADPEAESPNPADVLLTASAASDVVGKTYSAVSALFTMFSLFMALSVRTKHTEVSIMDLQVFTGLLAGAVSVFVFAGLILRAIRQTSTVLRRRLDNPADDSRRIDSLRGIMPLFILAFALPAAAGFVGGVDCLIAYSCSASLAGICLIFTFNDSGRYFESIAMETLGTAIKFMIAVSLVLAPFFNDFGGLL